MAFPSSILLTLLVVLTENINIFSQVSLEEVGDRFSIHLTFHLCPFTLKQAVPQQWMVSTSIPTYTRRVAETQISFIFAITH